MTGFLFEKTNPSFRKVLTFFERGDLSMEWFTSLWKIEFSKDWLIDKMSPVRGIIPEIVAAADASQRLIPKYQYTRNRTAYTYATYFVQGFFQNQPGK